MKKFSASFCFEKTKTLKNTLVKSNIRRQLKIRHISIDPMQTLSSNNQPFKRK